MRIRTGLAGLACLAFLTSCGPGEPVYFDISGTVTYQGKPVPMGTIYFEPDSSKGVKGQMGSADIRAGQYDTKGKGRGVLGGAYVIRLGGFDGKVAYEAPYGAALFPEYSMSKELPKEHQTLDIEVPVKR
jgi:hypothetical protein